MPDPHYPTIEIRPEWVLEPEALGSKEKFWYRATNDKLEWLFKFPQPNTGQHWAEKIAAEVAGSLGIFHARVELASFQGQHGSATESFARKGRSLVHGNQILAGQVLGYDPGIRFRQSDHTLSNIFAAIDMLFPIPTAARRTKLMFVSYLILDALIGNTDRHHENWGVLVKQIGRGWQGIIAPTFDHASSLGRELVDNSDGKCRERLLKEGRVGPYAEKAPGAIFWNESDKHGLSPLELVRRGGALHPDLFKPPLKRLNRIDEPILQTIVDRVPKEYMTTIARKFAIALMCYNFNELRKIGL